MIVKNVLSKTDQETVKELKNQECMIVLATVLNITEMRKVAEIVFYNQKTVSILQQVILELILKIVIVVSV
jgi:NAD-dependent SIR2 family protein deacetylase